MTQDTRENMPSRHPLPAPKNPAAAGAMLRALLGQQPAAQADPQDSLTKYLLALNATLAELRADMAVNVRLDAGNNSEGRLHVCENIFQCLEARREVYAEIARVVGEPDPRIELRTNNTPLASPAP